MTDLEIERSSPALGSLYMGLQIFGSFLDAELIGILDKPGLSHICLPHTKYCMGPILSHNNK